MEMPATTPARAQRVRENVARAAAIVVLMLVIGLLASTYFGRAKGPYGVCYGQSGRSIPCELATKERAR